MAHLYDVVGEVSTDAATASQQGGLNGPYHYNAMVCDNGVRWATTYNTGNTPEYYYSTDDGATWTKDTVSTWPAAQWTGVSGGMVPLTANKFLYINTPFGTSGGNFTFEICTLNGARTGLSSTTGSINISINGAHGGTQNITNFRVQYDPVSGDHLIAFSAVTYNSGTSRAHVDNYMYQVDVTNSPTTWTQKIKSADFEYIGTNSRASGCPVFDNDDTGSYEIAPYSQRSGGNTLDVGFVMYGVGSVNKKLNIVTYTESGGTWTKGTVHDVSSSLDGTTSHSTSNVQVSAVASEGTVYFNCQNGPSGGLTMGIWSFPFGVGSTITLEDEQTIGTKGRFALVQHGLEQIIMTFSMGNDHSDASLDHTPGYRVFDIASGAWQGAIQEVVATGASHNQFLSMFATYGASFKSLVGSTWNGTSARALEFIGHEDNSYNGSESDWFLSVLMPLGGGAFYGWGIPMGIA